MFLLHVAPGRLRMGLFVAGWFLLVVVGQAVVLRYESKPGMAATPPQRAETGPQEQPSVLVFAHPQCPCTRATLEELDRIATRVGNRARIQVFVLSDPNEDVSWTHSGTWYRAASIPGVEVREDTAGEKARALGVATSGETLVYSADGRLLYHGGITSGRGHVGDNAGAEAVVDLVLGRPAVTSTLPVFGCSLFGSLTPEETRP